MSATNRGATRKPYDFYATPIDVVDNLLNNMDIGEYGTNVLDPGAGNGNIYSVIKRRYPDKNVTALEIREEEEDNLKNSCDEVIIKDYLKLNSNDKYDIIIGNPPYSEAIEFIQKSLELLNDNGVLIFLLRTNFLESKSRYHFWQNNPLSRLYTLSKRPSFTGKGTDSISYSWFVWDKKSDKQLIKVI